VPYQLESAEKALTKEEGGKDPEYAIFLTGHSLGGALASLLAAKQANKPPVVTFNSPGMKRSFISSHFIDFIVRHNYQNYTDISKFLHIRANGDLVSRTAGDHMGKVETVYVDAWGDGRLLGASRYLAQHSIDNMVACLKPKTWYHKDLQFSKTPVTPEMMEEQEQKAS
jgi:putative lipase involved disintegration of autophagic bodies